MPTWTPRQVHGRFPADEESATRPQREKAESAQHHAGRDEADHRVAWAQEAERRAELSPRTFWILRASSRVMQRRKRRYEEWV
jgi:hypothetical protein